MVLRNSKGMTERNLAQTSFSEAENYEQISSIEREDGLKLINLVAVARGSKVLDLGCGTGFLANVLADLVGPKGQVVAIDTDKTRLAIARAKYQANNLEFLEGSAEAIPGGDYDLVFSNHVLHWCSERSVVFALIASSLKPGGRVACNYTIEQHDNDNTFDFLSYEYQQKVTKELNPVHKDECNVLIYKYNFRELHRSQHECIHTFKEVHEFTEFFWTHLKCKIENKDIDMDVIHTKIRRDGALYLRYQVLTIVMEKD